MTRLVVNTFVVLEPPPSFVHPSSYLSADIVTISYTADYAVGRV